MRWEVTLPFMTSGLPERSFWALAT